MGRVDDLRRSIRRATIRAENIPLGDGAFFSLPNFGVIRPRINLLIVGCGKCGTSSLHAWLGMHPDICMSSPLKEPEYFAPPGYESVNRLPGASQTDLMRLMLHGYRRQKVFGEASPVYTDFAVHDVNPMVAIVHEYNPQMRIIYTIRNPVARLISHFQQDVFRGRLPETATIPDDQLPRLLKVSGYGRQISHWRAQFPEDQIQILLLEEYGPQPRAALDGITDMLGVARFPDNTPFQKVNVTAERKQGARNVRLTGAQFDRVMQWLEPDIAELEQYLGRQVTTLWDMSRQTWCSE